jgi:DnaJ-class molecular chaperone
MLKSKTMKIIKTFKGKKLIVESTIVDCSTCLGEGRLNEFDSSFTEVSIIECPTFKGTGKVRKLFNPEQRNFKKALL